MMTSSDGNIFRVTCALCGEFTGHGEFPPQSPVTRSFDVSFDPSLNKLLSKQPLGWWYKTLSRSLWCHCNVPKYVAWLSQHRSSLQITIPEAVRPRDLTYCSHKPQWIVTTIPSRSVSNPIITWHCSFRPENASILNLKGECVLEARAISRATPIVTLRSAP